MKEERWERLIEKCEKVSKYLDEIADSEIEKELILKILTIALDEIEFRRLKPTLPTSTRMIAEEVRRRCLKSEKRGKKNSVKMEA